jgi:hypothetical protein
MAARWPLPVGAKVVVTLRGGSYEGVLSKPLPEERGWVVLDVQGRSFAFPMVSVQSIFERR